MLQKPPALDTPTISNLFAGPRRCWARWVGPVFLAFAVGVLPGAGANAPKSDAAPGSGLRVGAAEFLAVEIVAMLKVLAK